MNHPALPTQADISMGLCPQLRGLLTAAELMSTCGSDGNQDGKGKAESSGREPKHGSARWTGLQHTGMRLRIALEHSLATFGVAATQARRLEATQLCVPATDPLRDPGSQRRHQELLKTQQSRNKVMTIHVNHSLLLKCANN